MFVAVLSYFRKRSDRQQNEIKELFWEREQRANFVRRQDISGLSYISIPFDYFSIGVFSDETLIQCEQALASFRDKKILNLTGLSNTELKLMYGPANLPDLTLYDENYAQMLHILTNYSNRLLELGHFDAAIPVLEFWLIHATLDVPIHVFQPCGQV